MSQPAEPAWVSDQTPDRAALRALAAFGRDIAFADDLSVVFTLMYRHLSGALPLDRFAGFTVTPDRAALDQQHGVADAQTTPYRLVSLAGGLAEPSDPVAQCGVSRHEVATERGLGLCLPLLLDDRLLGVVSVTARRPLQPVEHDLLEAFCIYAALAVSHHTVLQTAELLREAIDQSDEAVSLYDSADRVVYTNPAYHRIFPFYPPRERLRGLTYEDLTRLALNEPIHNDPLALADPAAFRAEQMRVFRDLRGVKRELQRLSDRTYLYVRTRAAGGGTLSRRIDITDLKNVEAELRATQRRLEDLAYHDSLTGLPNRLVFTTEVAEAMQAAAPDNQVAVLLLDLDRFKTVNDTLGADVGDAVLREAAARLRGCVGAGGLLARLGDDEFAILVAHDPRGVPQLADAIVLALGTPFQVGGRRVVAGTSIGIATTPADATDVHELLRKADVALGRAKAEGRGGWRAFAAPMDAALQERTAIGLDLHEALAREQMHVVYQPVVALRGGGLTGFEALLRWTHPLRGLVPPAVFIPIAEEIGLIAEIGGWVLRQACADAATWPASLRLSVNVSPLQFAMPDLVETVTGALAASRLAPTRLELEVTESVLLADHGGALGMLHRLRRAGIGIALDDFGTGYASLSTLCNFPFTSIKIDQSFVRSINERRDSQAVVTTVTDLARRLGMTTTAEGVETADQLAQLMAAGCTRAQGYLISQPLSRPEAEEWIAAAAAAPAAATD